MQPRFKLVPYGKNYSSTSANARLLLLKRAYTSVSSGIVRRTPSFLLRASSSDSAVCVVIMPSFIRVDGSENSSATFTYFMSFSFKKQRFIYSRRTRFRRWLPREVQYLLRSGLHTSRRLWKATVKRLKEKNSCECFLTPLLKLDPSLDAQCVVSKNTFFHIHSRSSASKERFLFDEANAIFLAPGKGPRLSGKASTCFFYSYPYLMLPFCVIYY